jgi:predicted TIM-barrel fold metal-dependent hydrolase
MTGEGSVEKVVIVSADGHAVLPPELWTEYLEQEHHAHLPALRRDSDLFTGSMSLLSNITLAPELDSVFDTEGVYRAEQWRGVFDPTIRLQEMDREGVAAEMVFPGDFRAADVGFSTMNDTYPFDFVDAGVRAFDRWAFDAFGPAKDRFLLVGPTGTFADRDAALREIDWVADHGFTGTFAPGFAHYAGMPPLDDPFWEPVWSRYEEAGLALVVHGGYGFDQGVAFAAIADANAAAQAKGGGPEAVVAELAKSFNSGFFNDLRCREALWQLLFSGVFDRHPNLKLMMTEVRADWIPATLRLLDRLYDEHRDVIVARRKPSEYWATNCMAGLSFMHRSEVDMRDEIGVETVNFGRDYPHTEGTWPNTGDYLRVLFRGVPERDVRLLLGENIIRFLGLEREPLAAIAERIGPSIAELTDGPEIEPRLLEHLAGRCGILRPAEGESRVAEMEPVVRADLARLGALASR